MAAKTQFGDEAEAVSSPGKTMFGDSAEGDENHTSSLSQPTQTAPESFLTHATKTLRALPDAFQSGRILTDPLKAVGQSMQDYITTPSVHNFLRAIPGVGMAEDAITQPYRTAKSGDIAGAWGDAADLGGQLLAGRAGGAIPKVSEPLRTVTVEGGESALPSMNPIAGAALRLIPGGKTLRKAYDFVRESGIGPKASTTRVVGPSTGIGPEVRPGRSPGSASWQQAGIEPSERQPIPPVDPIRNLVVDPGTRRLSLDTRTPSGRTTGGPQNIPGPTPPSAPRTPMWAEIPETQKSSFAPIVPIRGPLPSGRIVGGPQNIAPGQFAPSAESQIIAPSLENTIQAGPSGIANPPDYSDTLQRSIEMVRANRNARGLPPVESRTDTPAPLRRFKPETTRR